MIQDTIKANDGFIIPISYFPVKEPKGLIQIVHGSWEHKGRYYEMIQYLNDAHFSCIISDNRGHGEAINDHYPSGHMENLDETIEDLYLVSQYCLPSHIE